MANNYERKINPSQTVAPKKVLLEKNKTSLPNSEHYSNKTSDRLWQLKGLHTTRSELLITVLYKQLHSLNPMDDLNLIHP